MTEASLGCSLRQGVAARVSGAAGSFCSTDGVGTSLLANVPAQEQASSASASATLAEIGRQVGHGEGRDI